MLRTRRFALAAPLLSAMTARAQAWPSRAVRFIVPYAASGGTDILTRALAEALRPALAQPLVVENRAGAAGVIGTEQMVRGEPDGHIFAVVVSTHIINRHSLAGMPFHPLRDVAPVAMLARNTMMLAASTTLPFADIAGLAAHARANPRALSTGSTEALSQYLGQEMARRIGADIPDVQYRSGGQLMTDIVAGHLPLGWTSTASVMPHMASGRARLLAASTATRTPLFPGVPTAQEQGFAEFDMAGWVAILAPRALPEIVAERMNAALAVAFDDVAFRQRLAALGIEADLRGPAQLHTAMEREDRIWAAAAAAGHIQRQ